MANVSVQSADENRENWLKYSKTKPHLLFTKTALKFTSQETGWLPSVEMCIMKHAQDDCLVYF